MTKRQAETYRFIAGFIQERGYSPSYAEIGDALGMKSRESVYRMVRALAVHGKITFIPHRARSIELTREAA